MNKGKSKNFIGDGKPDAMDKGNRYILLQENQETTFTDLSFPKKPEKVNRETIKHAFGLEFPGKGQAGVCCS